MMHHYRFLILSSVVLSIFLGARAAQKPGEAGRYIKKGTRAETAVATLKAFQLPTLEGNWYYAGPFDNENESGFDRKYPPEIKVDLKQQFTGKLGEKFSWKELPRFRFGQRYNLKTLFNEGYGLNAVVYVAHVFESDHEEQVRIPISLGADDTMSVWFNGKRLIHENHNRAAAPHQYWTQLKVHKGTNTLLLKICQYGGDWEFMMEPELPDTLPSKVLKSYNRDFPKNSPNQISPATGTESQYYEITTLPTPEDCVLEVGGLALRPDGKLLACTRRGEIWLIENPDAKDPAQVKFSLFAEGLHEALGLWVEDNKTVYVVQRPELTKIVDRDADGQADEFQTINDEWGVSGDYHEFAFGPARDKQGNFFITLNVGFGGGHQAKSPWRGWCVKIDAKTKKMEPWAYGLRSPNGVNFSPEGELFYCDNQGEWVATNKMHHLKQGKFYGHQAGLKWVKNSPFAKSVKDTIPSGMMYDGQAAPGRAEPTGFPELDPPCIWFPYGRMGQSITEPKWDTTAGKFGPFAGQCFVGDQTKSMVMRVALEKVNGVYQGACFPFRSGLQCGVNRIEFGPDGSMYVGQTNRGWGSIGGKPFGLQRINFRGKIPPEIHHVTLTKTGFDLHMTTPLDRASLQSVDQIAVKSFTYIYKSQYGCPETDTTPEKVLKATISPDGKTLGISVPNLRRGRVFEIQLDDLKTTQGESLVHTVAYYTLNELKK